MEIEVQVYIHTAKLQYFCSSLFFIFRTSDWIFLVSSNKRNDFDFIDF